MDLDKTILYRYTRGQCTAYEKLLVESWINQYQHRDEPPPKELLKMLDSLDRKVIHSAQVRRFNWRPMWFAASVLFLIGFALYFFNQRQSSEYILAQLAKYKAPDSGNAVLVLENFQEYNLDSLSHGDTLFSKDYLVTRLKGGELHYILHDPQAEYVMNTVRTRQGGMVSLVLSDGTKLWLNANSEITYPIRFKENLREVNLKGEGYFEVAQASYKNQRVPFYVRGDRETISVLGTKFNVNYYKKAETFLLEGKVAIAKGGPDNEVEDLDFDIELDANQVYANNKIQYPEDISRYIDWKDGFFYLNDQPLGQIVEKLSSWYGLTIEVDPSIRENVLFGRISRKKNLKEVLEVLSAAIPMEFQYNQHKLYLKKAKF